MGARCRGYAWENDDRCNARLAARRCAVEPWFSGWRRSAELWRLGAVDGVKFVHYRPRTVILNNLEYDHADIFCDLAAIETQFHHLVRTVPRTGKLIVNG